MSTSSCSDFPYLHGFSETEQARLMKQARLAESTIFHNIDYSNARRLLEVGSGVGAQTEILLRRFPDLQVACVDLNEAQIGAARANLGAMPWLKDRYELHHADATADLEQATHAAVVDVVEDRRFGQPRLFHQACLLGLREPVQVRELGGAG